MLFFLITCLSFLLFTPKLLLPVKHLPSWVHEMRQLLVLLCQEFLELSIDWLKDWSLFSREALRISLRMPAKKKCASLVTEHVEEAAEVTILDLPELALECILGKLSPAGLSRMACVCSTLRDMCRSDHLWERHLKEKWGRLLGRAALRKWESAMALKKDSFISCKFVGGLKPLGWMDSLSCVWPLSWCKFKLDDDCRPTSHLPADSLMSLYLALESGKFWFPAQVYNRENGHVGFMLSCYDAELSYDGQTDTFFARYPPHGRRPVKVEGGVQWDRLRIPPVNTPPHELHVSDCLNDLRPGDHIEIQWRKNKEFPYGWWYGVVGHLESCDGNDHRCLCHKSDTIEVEFNQYTPGSRWRQATVSRKNHLEEGNETDGFYGGIRKLQRKEEISMWRRLWPTEVME